MADRRQSGAVRGQESGVSTPASSLSSSFIAPLRRLPPTAYRLRWAAFTLVELLVVIAIIGILIALLAAGHSIGPRSGTAHAVLRQFEKPRFGVLRV